MASQKGLMFGLYKKYELPNQTIAVFLNDVFKGLLRTKKYESANVPTESAETIIRLCSAFSSVMICLKSLTYCDTEFLNEFLAG